MSRTAVFFTGIALVWGANTFAACGDPTQGTQTTGSGGSAGSSSGGAGATGGVGGSTGGSSGSTGTGASGGSGGSGGAGGSTGGTGGSAGSGGSTGGSAGSRGGSAGSGGSTGGSAGSGGSTGGSAGSGGGSAGSGGSTGGSAGSGGSSAGAGGSTGGSAGSGGSTGGSAGSGGGSAGSGGGTGDAGPGGSLHFAVYGDTRTGSATHQQVVDQIAKLNPQLLIHSGDLWDGYTQAEFTSILTKNANIGALLNNNLYVVARGNHETVSDYLAFKPSLARGNQSETFSYTVGNSFFVVLGMDPSGAASFLDTELKKPEATSARWRFVSSHYPIYSGGTTHGASGIPSIEKLCDQYHVAVYWSGHDHIYERSHQVFNSAVVDTSDALMVNKGTVYIVSGGGGAPLYGVAKIATTHTQSSTNNYIDVIADATTLTVKAYKLDASALDSFVISQ